MLTPGRKATAAAIFGFMKVSERQLKDLALLSKHEKLDKALEHLEHSLAEIEDAVRETRDATEM